MFNPIVKLAIPIGIPSKEAKPEIQIHPVIVEAKIRNIELYKPFGAFYSSIYFAEFL